jgi:hypothetical protein
VIGILSVALKVVLIGLVLVLAAAAIGIGFWLYKRWEREPAEA